MSELTVLADNLGLVVFTVTSLGLLVYLAYAMARPAAF